MQGNCMNRLSLPFKGRVGVGMGEKATNQLLQ